MAIDLLGGVFSDLSLVFKPKFDVIAGVAYSLVVVCTLSAQLCTFQYIDCDQRSQVLDGVVILLALILNPLAARRRRCQPPAAAIPDSEVTTAPTEKDISQRA